MSDSVIDETVAVSAQGVVHRIGRAPSGAVFWQPKTICGRDVHSGYGEVRLRFLNRMETRACGHCFKHVDLAKMARPKVKLTGKLTV